MSSDGAANSCLNNLLLQHRLRGCDEAIHLLTEKKAVWELKSQRNLLSMLFLGT